MEKTLYDIEPSMYVDNLAKKLEEIDELKMPEWANFVKTSSGKERPPVKADWWYKRAASILRQIYVRGTAGVGGLSVRYGTRKNRGMRPERFRKASTKIIRNLLQACEKAGLLERTKDEKSVRKLTKKGKQFLDSVAQQ